MPTSVELGYEDLFYPKAWGHPTLQERICEYYNTHYGSNITPDNVFVAAGGRPAICAVMAFLEPEVEINIVNPAWPAYIDIMKGFQNKFNLVDSNVHNGFFPKNE